MYATIQKWGNSQGLRIPKTALESVGLRENDRVEIEKVGNCLQIKAAAPRQHRTLEERLTAFYGKDAEELDRIDTESEVDWGKSEGTEAW